MKKRLKPNPGKKKASAALFRFKTRALKPFGNPAEAIFCSPGLLATLLLAGYVSNPLRVPFLAIPVTLGE